MIKNKKAIKILESYSGKNPYLKKLKIYLTRDGHIELTTFQVDYVIKNKDKEPDKIDKIVEITEYLGESLQKDNNLSFKPKRILIEYIVGETDKIYHVYGKVNKREIKGKLYFIPKTQLIDDPYYVDEEMDVDFDYYEELDQFELPNGKIGRTLYNHQKEGVKFLLKNDGCIMADDMGMGKANSVDTEVFIPGGKTTMGELKVGDYVIGSNGKKTKVLGVYPQPIKELYRVTFNDGFSTLCCKEHIWSVTSRHGKVNSKDGEIRYHDLTVGQMLDKNLNIKQKGSGKNRNKEYKFKTYYKQPNGQNKWQIPIVKPIEFENEYKLPIEPYMYGSLPHTKFIPGLYKYASIEDRISLLQGLMDVDGYCTSSKGDNFNGVEYVTIFKQLADDVAELVHSLGGIVILKEKMGTYKKPDDTKVICKKHYKLNIKFSNNINPFKISRKANKYNPPKKYVSGRYIKDISFEKMGKSVCINVEAEDSLYVIEHAIVTHNTIQTIIAALESGSRKILIVCPSAVKINWEREIQYFQETETSIINGRKWVDAKFTIINFDILKNFHQLPDKFVKKSDIKPHLQTIIKSRFDLCIIDEAHKLKNKDSKRGEIMSQVCKYIPRVWLLTGTPVANRPMDLYNLLKLIKSPLTTNYKHYVTRYCEGKLIPSKHKNKNGSQKMIWLTNGADNLDELASKVKKYYIRRLKDEVGDMPDKIVTPLYHDMSKNMREEYERLWEDYLEKRIIEGKKGIPDKELVELGLLRKFVSMQMIPNTIELAKTAIEEGRKVIIFTNFTDELLKLHEELPGSVTHYGQMSDSDKQESIDKFQNNKNCKIFIGNIISAGVGITLTASDYVIFNSFDWVPGNNEQSEDRCIFGNQWVMTDNGYKMIQDIEIGENVYTHKGNFKKVIDKTSKLERKKIRYDINAYGFNCDLSVTHDHKIYVYNNNTEGFEWVEAKDLNILNHSLTLKSNNQPNERLKTIKIGKIKNKTFINHHGNKQINGRLVDLPNEVELTNELLYAFGFYIADGWCSISDNKSDTINVCQKITNAKMYDASEYIVDIFKRSFNIKKHSSYIDKTNTKTCTIHSSNLAHQFKEWFGVNVYSKQFPEWVDYLNDEQLIQLLDGYYHGDGYRRKNTQQAATASLKLISQLIRYNSNLNRAVSLSNKDVNNYSIEYRVSEKLNNKKINKIGDYITYPIKSIKMSKPKRGEERVYDLSVEDDHSFVVGNYNVHNCFRIGQKNNVNVIYQLFSDSVSEIMWKTLNKKKDIIDKILGVNGVNEEKVMEDTMSELLTEIMDEIIENYE